MTTIHARRVMLAVAAALALAVPAAAQRNVPDTGGRVYGLVGGSFGDGTLITSGAGAGLRLTRHLGLDLEIVYLSGDEEGAERTSSFGAIVAGAYPPPGAHYYYPFSDIYGDAQERSVTTFLTKFTLEFPVAGERLFPYLTGGGGVGRVTDRALIGSVPLFPLIAPRTFGETQNWSGFGVAGSLWPSDHSETGLGLVLGGGIDVRLWRGLGIGAEVRWLRVLLSYDNFDTAQVVSRMSYRF